MITLEQLLDSRDRRAQHQRDLLAAWPGSTLVCLTVQLPGPVKRNAASLQVGAAGRTALLDKFGDVCAYEQVRDLETGYEAYFLIPQPADAVKRVCCGIEETHPLGRLMDIDVLGPDGLAIERTALGFAPRRCLLCGEPARYCMRARTHTPEELQARIDTLVAAWISREQSADKP